MLRSSRTLARTAIWRLIRKLLLQYSNSHSTAPQRPAEVDASFVRDAKRRAKDAVSAHAPRTPEEREHAEHGHEEWTDEQSPQTGGLAFIAAAAADTVEHPAEHPKLWSGAWFRGLCAQLVKFGLIGGTGMLVDMGMFNLLRATVLSPDNVAWGAMAANVISTILAIIWNWIGNRLWTFREHRRGENAMREGLEFFGVSLAGMLIGLIPLWITHYGLGLTSAWADNIAKLAGIGVGSVFRFSLYRWWVYAPWRAHRKVA